jgi:hypothetical protein
VKSRKRNATGYPITATLKSTVATGALAPVDLTGSTVYIAMRNRQTGEAKINEAVCTLVSAPNGQVSYTPSAADVDTAGVYDIEFKQVRPDTSILYYPSAGFEPLTIEESLG